MEEKRSTESAGPMLGELFRAFAVFVEPPSPEHQVVATSLELGSVPDVAEHTGLFDFQLYPFASVYLGPEGMEGGEARDRIAGFWRVLELEPPKDPDHLTVLLAAYGALLDRERVAEPLDRDNWNHVRQVFLHEHLLSWVPLFLTKVATTSGGFYRRWADKLLLLLESQPVADTIATELPAALREAAELPDPRQDGGAAFLAGLLAPGRAGFILTRDDLAEIAATVGIARRIGERRFVLENLLSQDSPNVLHRLAEHAGAAASNGDLRAMPELSRSWWCDRAAASRGLLASLAQEAQSP